MLHPKKAGANCVKFQSWSKDSFFPEKLMKTIIFSHDYRDIGDDYTMEEIVEEYLFQSKKLLRNEEVFRQIENRLYV